MGSLELQQSRRFDGACILTVGGELDESTVDTLEQGLEVSLAGSSKLVVDLTMCTVSSDGLATLIDFHGRTSDRGTMTLVAREPCLLRMLHAVGLTTKLGTYPTVDVALSSQGRVDTAGAPSRHLLSSRYPT